MPSSGTSHFVENVIGMPEHPLFGLFYTCHGILPTRNPSVIVLTMKIRVTFIVYSYAMCTYLHDWVSGVCGYVLTG